MDIKSVGEFGFIDEVSKRFRSLVPTNLMGIGDDCAIIPANEDEEYVVTADLLVEGVHFLRDTITPEQLGYKSLAVNLSDIAAMGAKPIGAFMSIAIPKDVSPQLLDGFTKGFLELSQKYETPLLGGDTTKSLRDLMINITVIGKCKRGEAKLRSGAQDGDCICSTGFLGDSAAGLNLLLNNHKPQQDTNYFIERHNKPEPRINEGLWLAKHESITSMMDISDGVGSDLSHIAKASNLEAVVNIDRIPISEQLLNAYDTYNWNIHKLSISGGEDYELLFTINQEQLSEVLTAYQQQFGKPFYMLGVMRNGEGGSVVWQNDQSETFNFDGFNHY